MVMHKVKKESKLKKETKTQIKNNKSKKGFLKKIFKNINVIKSDDNKLYTFEELVIIMIISLIIGFFTCYSLIKIFTRNIDYITLSKDLNKVVSTYKAITENYNGKVEKDKLVEGAVEGMISSVGDVYTNYGDSQYAEAFNETVTGVYEGIGCTVMKTEDGIKVVEVFADGPAEKAGLKSDDIIIEIDGTNYVDKTSDEMSKYIKNSKNNKIKLTILRDNEEKKITVNRNLVEIPTVTTKIYEKENKKIGYIDISIFSSVTDKQFEKKLKSLEKDKIQGLIIDVRGNNGGYLSSVTNITNLLLKKGQIIYKLQTADGNIKVNKDNTKEKRTYPIVVLIDEDSASASEILASAIKESYNGKGYVVGVNSYGKGTVQQTLSLEDGSMIKYTIENWLTPSGEWINEVGVTPTNYVKLNDEYYEDPTEEKDNQLQEALNIVIK